MFTKSPQSVQDADPIEINNDVTLLADALEDVLQSFASDAKEDIADARQRAEVLLKETRARMNGRGRLHQAAYDAASNADTLVRENPWTSVGAAAAVGLVIGALLGRR